jgi:hypothetical protein
MKGNEMKDKVIEIIGVVILGVVLGVMFGWGF